MRLLAALLLLGLGAATALASGIAVLRRVNTDALAMILVLLIVLGCALATMALYPALVAQLESFALRRSKSLTVRTVLTVFCVLMAVTVSLTVTLAWHRAQHFPWGALFGPLIAALTATLLALRVDATRGRIYVLRVLLLGALLFAALLPAPTSSWRVAFLDQAHASRQAYFALDTLLDFDRDGASSFFGAGDCAGFDATRSPRAIEIVANGVDEDCSGRDLAAIATVSSGKSRHGPPGGKAARPHIILITTDSLSMRHTGFGGYGRDITPNLDRFAAAATVFEHAFASSPATETALPALFSGVHAAYVGELHTRFKPPEGRFSWPATLASVLAAAGYRTRAVLGDDYFAPATWPGVTRGFGEVEVFAAAPDSGRAMGQTAPEVTKRAIEIVTSAQDRPLLLWVHYFDHHENYDPVVGDIPFGQEPIDRFDAELRFADRHWGKLLDAIDTAFEPDARLTIFTADHGEVFDDDHREDHHRHCLRSEEVWVPLVVQTVARRGERVNGLVSHLDLMPTLLDVADLPAPRTLSGESLVPVLFDGKAPEKTALFSVHYDPMELDPFVQVAVRTADRHFLVDRKTGVERLFAWRADPDERKELSASEPDTAEALRHLANRVLREQRAAHATSPLQP